MVLAVLAWPAIHPSEIDDLPLSNYPMFAHPRPRVTRFDTAVWIDAGGHHHTLDPRTVAGTDQPMDAAMALRGAIRRGDADTLCEEIAARLGEPGNVRIMSLTLDSIRWFRGDHRPIEITHRAECSTATT